MKTALLVLFAGASLLMAQDSPQDAPQDTKPATVKRLASVTWDLDTHKLVWVVQKGSEVNGEFVASSSEKYEVSPAEALMMVQDEKRQLGVEEAGSVIDLVNLLSLYCAQSTDWWEQGSSGATRVTTPEKKAPPVRMPGTLVAAAKSGSGK